MHVVAFVHVDLANDAALEMLDRLAVGLHRHRAVADDRAAERYDGGPDADDAERQDDQAHAEGSDAADIVVGTANIRHAASLMFRFPHARGSAAWDAVICSQAERIRAMRSCLDA